MNWHMIISVLIVVVLKAIGVTLFLLYFPQTFWKSNDGIIPTGSYGTDNVHNVSQTFESSTESFIPTRRYGTACPPHWQNFNQTRCFFLSTTESTWSNSRDDCAKKRSTLAIVNTPEKLKYLQDKADAEKYFIGLMYQPAENKWHWINNSVFIGNVTNKNENFNCVTIGLSTTFDAASCDVPYHWICEMIPR
ncbi:C-type lectin domain family 5 member A [Heterocephalus glaber]|uniref:C-type lectin domain family 5 member A n=1 Tax=Heterocephalus glaber TaxID=10181 RepID=G5AVR9_HETGA|nr:C-type lectin domain family 5 member A [Heterocephalus glaber]XP_004851365.1 C-type lectin domain family 5 member A [Heterocephalus glaber]EHB01130.1 C-type lectin domain family 5 member A [Heterocephalus glaber]